MVDTFQVAIYAAARTLLADIPVFLVWLRAQLRRFVALLYLDKGRALKPTLCEIP